MADASFWSRPAATARLIAARGARGYAYRQAGFTLIELLVVCAIIIVITGVVLIDNAKFGGEVILENLAYDVALTIRQAQVYGIAVERFGTNCSTPQADCFGYGYGMYFSTAKAPSTTYILFADEDSPPSGIYDNSPSEVVETDSLDQGYQITGLCVIPYVGGTEVGSENCNVATEIDIVFLRPEPKAYISAGDGAAPSSCLQQNGAACNYEAEITLTSPKGDTRTVTVYATGQISVAQE